MAFELAIQLRLIQRILGLLLMVFSLTLLPPILVSIIYHDTALTAFTESMLLTFLFGVFLWFPVRKIHHELRRRDGFLIVVAFWVVLGLFGAFPFLLSNDVLSLTFFQAFFESLSGLTTTGATVIVGLDDLPPSLLFYRQELQWLGGMGIIVLAIAILPVLRIGGMQLFRAEIPGPVKDVKLTPRITETAKFLWYIYLSLTIACALAYWLAGMSVFDAITHSFATVSIGGFSTHDASLGYFDSSIINMIAVIFMIIAGVNFNLHFFALRKGTFRFYWKDEEFRVYLIFLFILIIFVTASLYWHNIYDSFGATLSHGSFQVVSTMTTTGFATVNFSAWPAFLPVLLIFASFIGGCAGSTGGGLKVVRIILLFKQGMREMVRLVHPHAQVSVKLGEHIVPDSVINAVWGFFSAYVAVFIILMLLLMSSGLDQVTAFSAVVASINNLGPGLGEVASNFSGLNDFAIFCLTIAMLLGRLELFTLLILFTPYFWRR